MFGDIGFVHKYHMPAAVDPAIAVIEAVDRRVELIVRADRGHQQSSRRKVNFLKHARSEMSLARGGRKIPFPGRIRQIESAGYADAFVVIIETRNHALDRIADTVVIGSEAIPVNFAFVAKRRFCKLAHDPDLALEQIGCGLENTFRHLYVQHRALGRDELVAARLTVDLGTPEAWQNYRRSARRQSGPVQFRYDLYGQIAILQCVRYSLCIGRCGREVPAHREENFGSTITHRGNAFDSIEPVSFRCIKCKFAFKIVAENGRHLFPNAHRAVALNI